MKVVYVSKKYTNEEMEKMKNTFVKESHIDKIFDQDIHLYSKESGRLLLKFRKKVLREEETNAFYEATYDFTKKL